MSFRKILFWMHLTAGCVAGVIILLMSFTGVVLTYERQMLAWIDRGPFQIPAGSTRLSVDELLTKVEQQTRLVPGASMVLRSSPSEPVEIANGRTIYVSPVDGRVLGRSNEGAHSFFQWVRAWHRWLGSEGTGREAAKAITGACNLAFLFIVASGMYLWMPKVWSKQSIRSITLFRNDVSGKARDFNWHNVFGIWTAIPLLIVVASAVPMSYQWGNRLIYQITGSEVPAPPGPPGKRMERPQEPRAPLNHVYARAEQQVQGWKSISMRLPERASADVVFTIDTGDGGQPHKRGTLTLDSTGALKRWETFADGSAGRQLRMWTRFAHTGEYYGIIGQTIAGIGSLAGVMLVWTGISLALRRLAAWRSRRARIAVTVG